MLQELFFDEKVSMLEIESLSIIESRTMSLSVKLIRLCDDDFTDDFYGL